MGCASCGQRYRAGSSARLNRTSMTNGTARIKRRVGVKGVVKAQMQPQPLQGSIEPDPRPESQQADPPSPDPSMSSESTGE